MASSLFQKTNPLSKLGEIKNAINAIQSGNADQLANAMAKSNPQFANFMRANQGKSADQIMQECGINAEDVKSILSMLR